MTNEKAIELLDNLKGMIEDNHGNDYDTAFNMAIRAIKEGEPVRHGHWENVRPNERDLVKCSECGLLMDVGSNYCPNCGAKMDEVGE